MSRSPDRKPLMAELILETLKRQEMQRAQKKRGWYWGSPKCSILIGLAHLFFGTLLLIYDISTNLVTESKFSVTSSLFFIICAILLFISARRIGLDRPVHYLIIIFAAISTIIAVCLIADTSLHINKICISKRTKQCNVDTLLIHAFLMVIVLIEVAICLLSVYSSYYYLKRLSNQITNLIYRSLITEDFSRLPKNRPDEQISLITVEESNSSPSSLPASLKTA